MSDISLKGVVEVHVHAKPDLYPRAYSDMELMEAGVRVQARAIVVKWHYGQTAARVQLCNEMRRRLYPEACVEMIGSIVLNHPVGGINPAAVETALKLGARIVWMPTTDSRNERELKGFHDGIVCVEHGRVTEPVREILNMIQEYDAVLGTGHLDAQESLVLIDTAKTMGIDRILVDHPEYWVTQMTMEQQLRLVRDYDVCIGRYYAQPMPDGSFHVNLPENLEAYRQIGYKNMIISTDGGQLANPRWEDALRTYMQYFADQGVPKEHIDYMAKALPAKLLGLPS
ncbi:DUF6282 family protein [Clostridium sp. AN503]|uniref:DUF6282 family protein n=1 Tax=Clostridium sp. AN503 TaxID=3160598 RepID=UPI00345B05A0